MKAFICLLVVGLSCSCLAAEIGEEMCNQRYQEALTEALNIKKDCETATFYDCCQIKNFLPTVETGKHEISATNKDGPFSASKLFTQCDMDTDNGGWTVIQRRVANGTEDFNRKWDDYEIGFGDLDEDFWLGLQNIHRLTTRDEVELRIDLQDEKEIMTWTYQTFRVDGPADNYRLHIGEAEGPSGGNNAMAYHNNRPFSTYDRDNDAYNGNCAQRYYGAWWHGSCYSTNLNGPHVTPSSAADPGATRIVWSDGRSWQYYPDVEMKIRRKDCRHQC